MAERKEWIVSLRAFAAIAIVALHMISGSHVLENAGMTLRGFIGGVPVQLAAHAAVPVFIMISGTLLLDPAREMPIKKLCGYIMRMVKVIATFGFAFCMMESAMTHGVKNVAVWLPEAVKNVLLGMSWEHMWYVYMLIGLYVITPVLRGFVKCADKKTFAAVLGGIFVLAVLIPDVTALCGTEPAYKYYVLTPTTYVFYYLSGYALTAWKLPKRKALPVCIVGGLAYCALKVTDILCVSETPDAIAMALFTVPLYALAMDSPQLNKISKNRLIELLSRYSFGIYIVHPLFLNIFYKVLHLSVLDLPIFVGEIVFLVVTTAASVVLCMLLCRIPFFKKMLL